MSDSKQQNFVTHAGMFEFSLLILAMLLGWLFSVSPGAHFALDPRAAAWGVAAAFPLFVAFLLVEHLPVAPIQRIQETVLNTIGKHLAACNWMELAALAALAGVGEEALFRGFFMSWVESWGGYWAGLIASSIAFGLMHAVTWVYTIFACAAGAYFGWLYDATGERNLLPPILCHATYDFLAFLVIVRDFRREQAAAEEGEAEEGDEEQSETAEEPGATSSSNQE